MKRNALIAAIAAAALSAVAWAGQGYGPGGYGQGYGMGYGMGHGMGYGGYGMGGMGFGGEGGHCFGQDLNALNLSSEQREKIASIQSDVSTKQFELMASMRELRTKSFRSGRPADSATYEAMADLRKKMFELNQGAQERIGAVLTAEQRAQWQGGAWRGAPGKG